MVRAMPRADPKSARGRDRVAQRVQQRREQAAVIEPSNGHAALDLPALESRLLASLVRYEQWDRQRPRLPTAVECAQAGRTIEEPLGEIREIERAIALAQAQTLADAAVQLRRLAVHVEDGIPARLLAWATAAVEGAALAQLAQRVIIDPACARKPVT